MGGYEAPLPQPVAAQSETDFVCFTDDPALTSKDWEIRVLEPAFGADSIRSARAVKILGHSSLAAYDETLWVDNRIKLCVDPAVILDEWLARRDLAVPGHSFRANVVTEFQAVLDAGLEDSSRLYEQLTHYAGLQPELLQHPAPWTAIMARRRTPEGDRGMEQWFRHVLRYSRRDQLSFVHAMHEAAVPWESIDLDNLESPLHEWREPVGRSARTSAFQLAQTLQPPVAALGEQQLHFEQTVRGLLGSLEQRERELAAAQQQVADLAELRAADHLELAELRAADQQELEQLRQRLRRARRARRRAERALAEYAMGRGRGRRKRSEP
ncbi:MAG TPA: glycosyltransferase domain-containing protein [Nocardioides sp.]|nr:glycosyltransferase domain-containing protein [Nocardioides sp.]